MDIDGKLYCPKCMRVIESEGVCPHCGYDPSVAPPGAALGMGTLLNDRYQLGAVIGQGGFGITYAAWDELLGRPVAIKEYFPMDYAVRNTDLADEVDTAENAQAIYLDGMLRFERESHLLAELQGIPEIVKVLDFFSENNTSYIVMEYIHGVPVDEWVREKAMNAPEILKLMRPVADALVSTHRQGVLHRDLTPNNILVQEDGSIKLIDFGSATERSRSRGTVVLTRKYAPIEQYGSEHGSQGPWTDVYGLGAVLYTLLCGEEPQEAVLRIYDNRLKSPLSRSVKIKRYQNAAIMAALAVKPDNRIQSMDEFRSRLYHLTPPEIVLRQRRLVRKIAVVAAVVFVLLAVLAANFSVGLPLGQGLLYSLRSDGWHVKGEIYEKDERTIPQSRLGIEVTQIDSSAFRGDQSLQSLHVPGSVHTVDDSAFYACSSLKNVVLEEGVERLGAASFADCPSLETASLPKSLSSIADTSFSGAPENMALLVSAGSVPQQWAQAQSIGCVSGLQYEIHGDSATITAVEDTGGKLSLPSFVGSVPVTQIADGMKITQAQTVILPRFLVAIPDGLFQGRMESHAVNDHLETVIIGSHVEKIGASAFSMCNKLKNVALPESLKYIGDNAFFASGLETVDLPDSVETIGEYAFSQTHIDAVTIPEGVTTFGNDAFSMTAELKSVHLPESLLEIPDRAFRGSGIENLRLPDNLQSIGDYAFWNSDLKCLVVPETVQAIGKGCFYECRNLKCVYLNLYHDIPYNSQFFQCRRSVYICGESDSLAAEYARESGCTFVDISAWSVPDLLNGNTAAWNAATAPEKLIVPYINVNEGVLIENTYIIDVFETETTSPVSEVTLSPFQTDIPDAAFFQCRNLESVKTEGEILSIGQQAFELCQSLHTFPFEHARYIYSGAFTGCKALRTITMSDDLIYIDSSAFVYCDRVNIQNLPVYAD